MSGAKRVSAAPVGHAPGSCSQAQLTSEGPAVWSEVPRSWAGIPQPPGQQVSDPHPVAENEMAVLRGTGDQRQPGGPSLVSSLRGLTQIHKECRVTAVSTTALPGVGEVGAEIVWEEVGNGNENMICKETHSIQTSRRTGPNKQ